jgi:hypothetical protein
LRQVCMISKLSLGKAWQSCLIVNGGADEVDMRVF